jgi:hypothetical protein
MLPVTICDWLGTDYWDYDVQPHKLPLWISKTAVRHKLSLQGQMRNWERHIRSSGFFGSSPISILGRLVITSLSLSEETSVH